MLDRNTFLMPTGVSPFATWPHGAGSIYSIKYLVNATYIFLIWELDDVPPKARRIMRVRSIVTLCLFGMAALVALKFPLVGLGICCCCLTVYLKPEAPGAESRISR
jgi:TMEM175 potassium channel family protein